MDIRQELIDLNDRLEAVLNGFNLIIKNGTVDSRSIDAVLVDAEKATIKLRNLAEALRPRQQERTKEKEAAPIHIVGTTTVNEFGWLHITLNTLLPGCKYKSPHYLRNTILQLLGDYRKSGRQLPYFEKAMLIIEEHCDIQSRQVFDQDNKGWKAIPNAIKGLIVPDDDQFTLELALLSKLDTEPACHIYVLPAEDAGEFFSVRTGNYGYTI